uniref:CRIB domain-containing protein RIC7-like n=1 Tax=Erigeron canadensis TaxID=72917 RepID=UPI001CB95A64|nr:CRIB domain-containing protein RIC7-like [Erigeron canadensis]
MGTKVKGFFRGLKNISNLFDEEDEEQEIQIGMPTDVKHLAHIGADGPAAESPSWMRDFGDGQGHSAPMDMTPTTNKGTKNHRITRSEELNRDLPDVPKTSRHRHHRSMDNSMDHESQSSTKTKHRRHHRIRRSHDKDKGTLPDIPKKSRRKKPKDEDGSTKSKDSESSAGDF